VPNASVLGVGVVLALCCPGESSLYELCCWLCCGRRSSPSPPGGKAPVDDVERRRDVLLLWLAAAVGVEAGEGVGAVRGVRV
jgi:hypothetical protein